MQIRTLRESDAEMWWTIRGESLEAEPRAFGRAAEEHRETSVESARQRLRDTADGSFQLGAFVDGAIVGLATFSRETGLKERHKGHVYGVYVRPVHRRARVARELLAALLGKAREDPSLEQVLLSVATQQLAARALYASFGFVAYGVEPRALKVAETYVDEHLMILRFT